MFPFCLQALQAPACHENMVKVGGYILGEFGNLIAGDPRSRLVRGGNFCTIYVRFCSSCILQIHHACVIVIIWISSVYCESIVPEFCLQCVDVFFAHFLGSLIVP